MKDPGTGTNLAVDSSDKNILEVTIIIPLYLATTFGKNNHSKNSYRDSPAETPGFSDEFAYPFSAITEIQIEEVCEFYLTVGIMALLD